MLLPDATHSHKKGLQTILNLASGFMDMVIVFTLHSTINETAKQSDTAISLKGDPKLKASTEME